MLSPRDYQPPCSVWRIVQNFAAPSEHHELKVLVGEDLIDQTVELRDEINLVLELSLLDFSDESDGRPPAGQSRLPEPPQMRERLTQEIVFFLESIREQAKQQTGVEKLNLKRLDVNQEVVDYAYESSSSRPSTAASRLSLGEIRVTPCSSRPESRSAAGGDAAKTADVAEMREQLTYMRCDEVTKKLRQYLQEEIDQLQQDLQSLQLSLSLCPAQPESLGVSREPSLADLKAERHKLEQALLTNSNNPALRSPQQTQRRQSKPRASATAVAAAYQSGCHSNKPANATIPKAAVVDLPSDQVSRVSSAQRLRAMVQRNRQTQPLTSHAD